MSLLNGKSKLSKFQSKLPTTSLMKKGVLSNNIYGYKKKMNNKYHLEANLIKSNKKFNKFYFENSGAK